ncbi:GatB/YqeY domain-containing protein [Candidatus Parcubacteria bacterium]|jgi:uncharacterized protein|nr:GatB/YqeY domain-containing protein [Candidatus Parcubacteria bacterium]
MSLQQTIDENFKKALKNKEEIKVSVMRMLKAAIKNKCIEDKRDSLDDKDVMAVIQKELKKRKDSIEAFEKADRQDLADKEKKELEILAEYTPEMMPKEEVAAIVDEVIAQDKEANFGQIMKQVMTKVQGKAEGQLVQSLVKEKLNHN